MVPMGVHRAYRKILSSNEYLRIAQNGCHVAGDIFKLILVLFRFKFPWNMHPIISKLWLVSIMTWGWIDKKQWSGLRMAYFANSYIGHLASMSKILVWTTPYRCFDWYIAMKVKCIVIIKCDLFVSCLVFICLFIYIDLILVLIFVQRCGRYQHHLIGLVFCMYLSTPFRYREYPCWQPVTFVG